MKSLKHTITAISILFSGIISLLNAEHDSSQPVIIESLSTVFLDKGIPEIPWTQDLDQLLQSAPLFELPLEQGTSAKGWIAANKEGFILYLDVIDDYHVNTRRDGSIWDGDAIQLGVDANGSGVGNRHKRSAFVGPDDASITFALTDEGPRAWAHYHGNPSKRNAIRDMNMSIVRDEETKHTIYTLYFDWEDFQLAPGLFDTMGFAVQLNDTDQGPDQLRLKWGDGAGGNLRPGLFEKVKIATPNEAFMSVLPVKTNVWNSEDRMKLLLANYTTKTAHLSLKSSVNEVSVDIPEQSSHRYSISITPDEYGDLGSYDIKVSAGSSEKSLKVSPQYPADIIENIFAAIDEKLKEETHPLAQRHISSIKAILNDVWIEAQKDLQADETDACLCAEYSQYLYDEISGYRNIGELIQKGAKAMVCTFKASTDSSLEYYKLLLPKNFDPEKTYPLIVDLHGSGNPYTLSFFSSADQKTIGTEEINENEFEVFVLQPWGRGNAGYLGNAGEDIYDGIRDLKETFLVDESKTYLTGFSMGGFGTWIHSLLHPEMWRAVVIAAGGPRENRPTEAKIPLLKELPIMIWHGDSDGAVSVKYAYLMQQILLSIGNEPEMNIIPGRGHRITAEDRKMQYRWFLSH